MKSLENFDPNRFDIDSKESQKEIIKRALEIRALDQSIASAEAVRQVYTDMGLSYLPDNDTLFKKLIQSVHDRFDPEKAFREMRRLAAERGDEGIPEEDIHRARGMPDNPIKRVQN